MHDHLNRCRKSFRHHSMSFCDKNSQQSGYGLPDGSAVNNSLAMHEIQETQVWSLGWEDPLEDGMETHASILVWRIPWAEEAGGLQPMGSQRVQYDWSYLAHTVMCVCVYTWEGGREIGRGAEGRVSQWVQPSLPVSLLSLVREPCHGLQKLSPERCHHPGEGHFPGKGLLTFHLCVVTSHPGHLQDPAFILLPPFGSFPLVLAIQQSQREYANKMILLLRVIIN